jgi:hypothetical protein
MVESGIVGGFAEDRAGGARVLSWEQDYFARETVYRS